MDRIRDGAGGAARKPDLGRLAALAVRAGAAELAADARALAGRVLEGRFFVACVGQFKRGKSTLLNALVGSDVLPTGVVPVTAIVTVLRSGPPAARVLAGGAWREVDPATLADFVSEDRNPGNRLGVEGVEVFVPSPILDGGLCLVDTPGLGSVFGHGTAATRDFLPHVDAALVVLGADPPIGADELALAAELAPHVRHLVFAMGKADRAAPDDLAQAAAFARRILAQRLGRDPGPMPSVSALQPGTRDWAVLVATLERLTRESGAQLVQAAARRGFDRLSARLLGELDAAREALLRPLEESERRLAELRSCVADAERSLAELRHRLDAEQERLDAAFEAHRRAFLADALPRTERELERAIAASAAPRHRLRARAMDAACDLAEARVAAWLRDVEPVAAALYREGTERFVAMGCEFLARAAGLPAGTDEAPEADELRTRHGFFFTPLSSAAHVPAWTVAADALRPRARAADAARRSASAYLGRLMESNASRVANDLSDRVRESRRVLEVRLRAVLRDAMAGAQRATDLARAARAAGAAAVQAELDGRERLAAEVESLRREAHDRRMKDEG